jgi:hypothetical protein
MSGSVTPGRSDLGVEVAVDDENRVAWITLHFNGDQGFQPFRGEISGRGGTIPRRMSLWAALGRPWRSTGRQGATDEWVFPGFMLQTQYEADDEGLPPGRRPLRGSSEGGQCLLTIVG